MSESAIAAGQGDIVKVWSSLPGAFSADNYLSSAQSHLSLSRFLTSLHGTPPIRAISPLSRTYVGPLALYAILQNLFSVLFDASIKTYYGNGCPNYDG
jgi:hypothetical protein